MARSSSARRSTPSNRIFPLILPGGSGMRRRTELAVTDLPQPLSPTIAIVSPASTVNDTPSTARFTPSGVRKCVCRFSTSSRAISTVPSQPFLHARIKRITQSVAKQIHRKDRHGKEYCWKEHDIWLDLPKGASFGHDIAPRRNGGRRAGSDERQDCFHDHGAGAHISGLHRHRRNRVGQNVAQEDCDCPSTCGNRRVYIGLLAQ